MYNDFDVRLCLRNPHIYLGAHTRSPKTFTSPNSNCCLNSLIRKREITRVRFIWLHNNWARSQYLLTDSVMTLEMSSVVFLGILRKRLKLISFWFFE